MVGEKIDDSGPFQAVTLGQGEVRKFRGPWDGVESSIGDLGMIQVEMGQVG